METLTPRQVLEQLNLLEGPDEQARIKNVALMMFCHKPERFFPGTQIDIVFYPEGKEGDPNNFTETEPFRGPVHVALRRALDYLRTMVIRRNIHKLKDDEHSIVVYNYPYQAIEEALVNAYFHRSYDSYQPVEVNIQPYQIEIISYGGAERSIKLNDLRAGRRVHARRYRNARLGEFFKELHLTEGRGTGLPTIHDELQRNGSPEAIIDADDEHTYFMIIIPCHPEFVCDKFTMDKEGHVLPVLKENVAENNTDVTENVTENVDVSENVTENSTSVTENDTDVTENVTEKSDGVENSSKLSSANKRRIEIIQIMRKIPKITTDNIANMLSVSRMTVSRDISYLMNNGKLSRDGGDKGGVWVIKED
jgi:ATP-dependent DNA helicase RecG